MPLGMHNPLPASLRTGFLGSARFGSGILVARLPDGSWSAPSAIATLGGGFGGQVGFELTDFVFILNDAKAVRTFSQAGSLTLGGNLSIALGPVGRNAEIATGASSKGVASMFTYSRTKGLFGGLSLEGSVLVERRSANRKLYERKITATQLLNGELPPPPEAESLMRLLHSQAFYPPMPRPPLDTPSPTGVELPVTAQNRPPSEVHVDGGGQQNAARPEVNGGEMDRPGLSPDHRPLSEVQSPHPDQQVRPASELHPDSPNSQHRPVSEVHSDSPNSQDRPVSELHSDSPIAQNAPVLEPRPESPNSQHAPVPEAQVDTSNSQDVLVLEVPVVGSKPQHPPVPEPHPETPESQHPPVPEVHVDTSSLQYPSVSEAHVESHSRPASPPPATQPDGQHDQAPAAEMDFQLPAGVPYFPPEKPHAAPGGGNTTATTPNVTH
ncbi:hypothetical protein FE257_008518 [Aspergillus nanangensis]|uniref:Ysc84 actin-binding domain-containing protein n=1 Tax=Aspergillus nanangensis TaxID=2582783 RepID=A0AAD4CLE7_ASPNN|nr:hypothetical protein FE257_008518 [Aspergillus nanangensis]